jgi:hypothetical protein
MLTHGTPSFGQNVTKILTYRFPSDQNTMCTSGGVPLRRGGGGGPHPCRRTFRVSLGSYIPSPGFPLDEMQRIISFEAHWLQMWRCTSLLPSNFRVSLGSYIPSPGFPLDETQRAFPHLASHWTNCNEYSHSKLPIGCRCGVTQSRGQQWTSLFTSNFKVSFGEYSLTWVPIERNVLIRGSPLVAGLV